MKKYYKDVSRKMNRYSLENHELTYYQFELTFNKVT